MPLSGVGRWRPSDVSLLLLLQLQWQRCVVTSQRFSSLPQRGIGSSAAAAAPAAAAAVTLGRAGEEGSH